MRVNDIYIFKFFIPLLFALTPVSVYLSIRRYADKTTALLTSFFFIAQPTFMTWWWIPVRQEVALLFYSFSVLALLDNNLSKPIRSLFFILFTFGMIVSHYSTSYISLTLFLFTYVFYLFYRKTEYINIFTKLYCFLHLKNPSDVNFRKQFLTFFSIAIPILFAIFWYSNQPTITNNFVNVIKKTVANVGDINNSKNKVEGASLGAQWNIFYQQKKQTNLLTKSQQNFRAEYLTIDKIKPYGKNIYERYRNTTTFSKNIPSLIPASIGTRVTLLIELIKKLIKVFIVFGTFHIIFRKFIDPKHSEEFVILNTGSLVAMLAILTLPVISIDYDLMRQYQQILVTLSYSCVLGGIICLFIFKRKALSQAVLLLVLTIFFLSQSGFIAQFVGGKSIYVHLNNYGDSYNQFYVHYSERVATKWLRDNWHRSNFIYADNRASFKLWYFDNAERKMLKKVVLPATIDKSAYVYSSYANTIDNISYLSSQGDIINHIFPTNFLEDNKSTIYNNGESKIYK